MFSSGFIINGFLFALVFGTVSYTGCRGDGCNHDNTNVIKVCQGSSQALSPRHGCPIRSKGKVKFKPSASTDDKFLSIDENKTNNGMKKYWKKVSGVLVVNNITAMDTGTYRYTMLKPGKIIRCCVSIKINCVKMIKTSGSNIKLYCEIKDDGTKLKNTTKWCLKTSSSGRCIDLTYTDGKIKNDLAKKMFSGGLKVSFRTLKVTNLKKSYSGNYTCTVDTHDPNQPLKLRYSTVLIVADPIRTSVASPMTAKETSPKTQTSQSSLPTVVEIPNKTPTAVSTQATADITKFRKRENVTNPTEKPKTFSPRSVASDDIVVAKNKGKQEPRSFGTRSNAVFPVCFLCQLYVWNIFCD